MKEKKIINYLFELGVLKKFFHNGPQVAGVKEPDTLAEHSFRAAIIGFILGELEGVSGEKVATMLLFHDAPEARIGDHNKIAQRYMNCVKAEEKVMKDQIAPLPKSLGDKIKKYWQEHEKKSSKEGIIARDADLLETALQVKEYADIGYPTKSWISNIKKHLKTKSAKKMLMQLEKTHFTEWWDGLKKLN
jgi:putative hydrolase of HD superfamily